MTSFRPLLAAALPLSLLACSLAPVQEAPLPPPAALVLEGIPPVPTSLAAAVGKYTEFKPTRFASWHPTRHEMMVSRRHKNTAQLYRLARPGGELELLTDYAEPVRNGAYLPPDGKHYIFVRDTGGNEVYRGYRREVEGAEAVAVTPEGQRVSGATVSKDGKFSWMEVECLGACVNAPMLQIGKDFYEDLDGPKTEKILEAFRRGETPKPGPQNGRHSSEPEGGPTTLKEIA